MTTMTNITNRVRKGRLSTAGLALAIGVVAAVVVPRAEANAILGFDDVNASAGTLEYDGDGTGMRGVDIYFDQILGTDTPLNSGAAGALSIVDGALNFETGSNISEPAGTPGTWQFNGGGTFVLTGKAYDSGLNLVADGSSPLTPLISGTFAGGVLNPQMGIVGTTFGIFLGFGTDTKHEDLLTYFGILDNNFAFANTEISSGNVVVGPGMSFTANVVNADIDNFALPDSGMTFILLGASLAGLGAFSRWARR